MLPCAPAAGSNGRRRPRGRRLGLLGLGRLGTRVAEVGLAFGMEVVAWSQNLTAEAAAEAGATRVGVDELLRSSDVVSIHLRLSDRTRGLVGARELGLMRPGALLINTSRGPIVDEAALLDALHAGTIGGAGAGRLRRRAAAGGPSAAQRAAHAADAAPRLRHGGDLVRLFFEEAVQDIEAFLDGAPLRALGG